MIKTTCRTFLILTALALMALPVAIYADTATFTYHDEVDKRMVREDYGQNVAPTFKITVLAGSGGSISPSGAPTGIVNVSKNGSQSFTIAAAGGYHIRNVYADGVEVGAVTSYPFTNVITNHEITALFDWGTVDLVKVVSNGGFRHTIEDAQSIASQTDTIQCQSVEFTLSGNPKLLSVTKNITLEGGYDSGFDYKPGYTTLHGVLQIDSGSLIVDGIIVAD